MSDGNIYDSILDAAPSQNPQKSLTVNPRQPAPSVYDSLLDQQDQQENQRLMESIARSAGKNADVEAEAQRLGFKTGVGPEIARNNMEEVRRRAAIVDIQQRRLMNTSPILARQLTDPNFAAIAHDQIDNLSTTEKIFKWFSDIPKDVSEQWEAGNLEYRLGVLGQRAQMGQAGQRDWQEITDIRGRLRNLSDDSTFLGGASRILGQMSNTLPQALAYGAATGAGFGGAAALAGQAGPQVLAPEEIITVPGAALAGFKVGTTYKMAEQAYQLEGGLAYLDMVDAGIDKATAQWASAGVGIINAGLETVSFGVAATPFKRLLNKAIGEEISAALVRPTVSQAVTGALRTYGSTILTEAGTESLQEFVSFIGEDLGRTFSKNELETKITTEEGRAELASRMGDVFVKTAMGMAVLGVPGAAVQFRSDIGRAQQAMRAEQFFTDLSNNAGAAAVRERNPAAYEQFIAAQAEGGRAENIFVDANEMANVLRQARITDADLNRIMPGMAEQLAGAIQTGSDVVIPTAQFAARVAGTDLGNAMVPHLRLDPAAMSAAEAKQFEAQKEQLKAEAQAVLDAKLESDKAFADSAKRVRDTMYTQLKETKTMPAKAAALNADFVRDFVVTQAAKLKIQPEEFYNRYMYKVQAAREGATPADLFDQELPSAEFEQAAQIAQKKEGPWLVPAVRVNGKVYGGKTHLEAIAKIPDETARRAASNDSNNRYYVTDRGRVIDRYKAQEYARDFGLISPEAPAWAATSPELISENLITPEAGETRYYQSIIPETIEIDGVERPVVNSAGRVIANSEQALRNFWAWFGDSKAVDAQGRPIVVYHGSGAEITQFQTEGGRGKTFGTGAFFSSNSDVAATYATGSQGMNITPVYLKLETPAQINADGANWSRIGRKTKVSLPAVEVPDQDEALLAELEGREPREGATKKLKARNTTIGKLFPETIEEDEYASTDDLARWARQQGYDGVIFKDVVDRGPSGRFATKEALNPSDLFVVFNPEQIKSINNIGEFSPETGEILRQSAMPQMMAVHNLTEDNLVFADKMGGLAVPSVGVVTAEQGGVQGFGDITLIGERNLVEPSKERVFSSDAYTIRFPKPEWPKVKSDKAQAFVNSIRDVANEFDERNLVELTWDNMVNSPDAGEVISRWQRSNAIRAMFLREQNVEVAPVMRPVPQRTAIPAEALQDIAPLLEQIDMGMGAQDILASPAFQAVAEKYAAIIRDKYTGRPEAQLERLTQFGYADMDRLAQDLKNAGLLEVDVMATTQAVSELIEPYIAQFKAWVDDKVTAEFDAPFIKVKGKKAPYTLENIVQTMTDKKVKGREQTMVYGAGAARAAASIEFSDLEQMRKAAKEMIVDPAEYELQKDETEKKLEAYRKAVIPFTKVMNWRGEPDTWEALDSSMRAIGKWSTGKKRDAASLKAALRAQDFDVTKIPDEAIELGVEAGEALLRTPVPYFEAKPQRIVNLDEFAGAVVPTNTSDQARAILEKNGVKVAEYQGEENRQEAIRALAQDLSTEGRETLFQRSAEESRKAAARFSQPARGGFDPRRLTTILNEKADLSTFLHETAHFFLTVYADMAALPDATDQMKADMQTILDWFGVADLDTWNKMSLEEQRKYHEQWAYNYELYLFEGKAPSVEMQSMFDKFSAWLKRVYLSIRDDLNRLYREEHNEDLPILTGEVRQVMDRMIASDDQIKRAEAVRNMEGLFQTQEQSGMDDAAWMAYQAMLDEAREAATIDLTKASLRQMQWLSNAKSRLLKEMQAKHDALRKEVRAQVEEEVKGEDVYKAIEFLKYGRVMDQDGNPIEVLQGNKLNLSEVKAMFPASKDALIPPPDFKKLGYGKYGMLSETGLSPDLVAQMFGFTSGEALVNALLTAKPIKEEIDARTDMRMLDEHGAMNTPAELEFEVEKALHNEARARFVAVELRFLSKATQPVRVMMKAAQEVARQIISGKKISEIKQRDYSVAEARAARQAMDAIKAGKSAEAARAKQNQLVQNQLTREAIAAKEEVAKALRSFKKIFRPDAKIAKTRNVDLVDAARSILAYYGLGKKDKAPTEYLEKLRAYNPDLYAELEPIILRAISGEPKTYRDLTMDEFRIMRDAVEALWFQAKRENEIMVEGKALDLNMVVGELNERLNEIGVPEEVPGERSAPSKRDRAVRSFYQAKAATRRIEHWADATDGPDGPGPFTKYIWRPIKDALNQYRETRNVYVKRYVELLEKLDLPVQKIEAPELNYTFGEDNGGIGKAEVLGALLHSGNESNLRKLLIGRGWGRQLEGGGVDTSRWDAFLDRMIAERKITKEDMDFVQAVWDLNEELKPMAQKAHHDLFGYYFREVEAMPVTTPWGVYRGGYVPAKTDQFIVRDAQRNSKMEELESDFRQSMPSTGMGFTKGRVEYNKALSLDIRLMAKHIDDVIRFAQVQPAVRDVLKLLRKREFADTLTRVDPTAIEDMLIPWLNRAARQITSEPGKHKAVDQFWSTVRARTGVGIMFANITNALQQVTGYFPAALKVRPSYLKSALANYMGNSQVVTQEVSELSSFMRDRLQNQIFDIQDTMNDLLLNPSRYEQIQKWGQKHGYFLQTAFQNQVDVVTWTATYNQALVELGVGVSDPEAVREAVQRADAAVRLTQSSLTAEDMAAFEVGTPFYKTLIQFSGYFNMLANLNANEYIKVIRDLGFRGNKGQLVYIYAMGFMLPMVVADAIVRSLGGQWDDEDDDGYLDEFMEWFFGSQVKGAAALVPFGSAAFTALTTAFNNKPYDDRMTTSPSVSTLEAATIGVGKTVINVASEDKDVTGKNVRDVLTLISLVTGIPVTVLGRPVGYVIDVEAGKTKPTGAVDVTRGLVTGKASEASKE